MKDRAILSVGLTQVFANCEKRNKVIHDLEMQLPESKDAMDALTHIHALEALIAIEKYASLSRMADDMRNDLAATRADNNSLRNQGYQDAINRVMLKIESIDIDSQAATSIAEIQAATLLSVAEEIRSPDDYATVVQFAKAINDGCC